MLKTIVIACSIFILSACAQAPIKNGQAQWDFDHHLQFKQTKLAESQYHLVVVANNKTHFSQLVTFLMRRSLELCQSYGFKMEVLAGVETFNHKLESPNRLMPSLAVNLECPTK
ncbi:MAG: hypothetical protein JKX78_00340 [Alteromonadaceae bacterium]|nr:hypothetical protein [Alteromonadaceae bacterium]